MAMAISTECIDQIGETAGDVWHALNRTGPLPLTKLVKKIDAPRDIVMQAIGWLAREEKISIEEEKRSKIVSLIEED